MPGAVECWLDEQVITVEEALRVRGAWRRQRQRKPSFRCRGCGEQVWPHHGGSTGAAAHFEHRRRNANCISSDPRNP